MARPIALTTAATEFPIEHWREGIAHFNQGRYWDAHESWEKGWVRLEPPMKTYVQSLIQIAAIFHLMGLGREEPARRLAKSALAKSLRIPHGPRIEIPGSGDFLRRLCRPSAHSEEFARNIEEGRKILKAELVTDMVIL